MLISIPKSFSYKHYTGRTANKHKTKTMFLYDNILQNSSYSSKYFTQILKRKSQHIFCVQKLLPQIRALHSEMEGKHVRPGQTSHENLIWRTRFASWIINPYPTAFPYGNGMVLHFYQQQESSTTKTVHRVINKGLKTYV